MTSRTPLTGWGRAPRSLPATRAEATDLDVVRREVAAAGRRGITARGLGRSYGDASLNAGGAVLDMTALTGTFDLREDGRLTVSAGHSLDTILRRIVPHGWWLPVVPGTRQVTVGGAIAADVHGKNHHVDGTFGAHVESLRLVVAGGDLVQVSPTVDPDLFWATVGGMGLTGVIVEATLTLHRVETSYFLVDTDRTTDVHGLLDLMDAHDDDHRYSVAWFDTATTGDRLGRAVLTAGDSAPLASLDSARVQDPLAFDAPRLGTVPFAPPFSFVNRWTARAFNELWYRKAPARRRGEVQDITAFFHPLDIVGDWNRVYGPGGFVQYQCVVPDRGSLVPIVEQIAESGHVSSLNVLKRFGEANASPLSFPTAGLTLAADFPVRRGLDRLLTDLDSLVTAAGGRLYLAKDSRTDPATLAAGYPRLDEFRSVRARVGATGVFTSDLARRLDL
ncbi:FAD-binding oxidoreductase [Aeromicrobium sp.]|uniref:FAD-binding oxidoreductase n=1 Tax=Aeromicrobium sp. TaxID=1871063 RepID=UPI0028AA1597|nr:FAD-binding oxidoreductase [Aeromicrobium sp.]